ncbi:conserved hypothetical protein [Paraburkholderia caribensis]|nr:conserved hypothetical protein [Paraburkholderia caribensis]
MPIGHPSNARSSLKPNRPDMKRILVSACLAGLPVRYDGSAKSLAGALMQTWRDEGRLVVVCPEVAAGFGTPRRPAEIQLRRNGRDVLDGTAHIRDDVGADVTALFIDGARHALQQALAHGCRYALLADGSPSCGSSFIHDGTFSGVAHDASGVTAALLERHGIRVFAPDGIDELAALIDRDR